jgi:hypothetical protein
MPGAKIGSHHHIFAGWRHAQFEPTPSLVSITRVRAMGPETSRNFAQAKSLRMQQPLQQKAHSMSRCGRSGRPYLSSHITLVGSEGPRAETSGNPRAERRRRRAAAPTGNEESEGGDRAGDEIRRDVIRKATRPVRVHVGEGKGKARLQDFDTRRTCSNPIFSDI